MNGIFLYGFKVKEGIIISRVNRRNKTSPLNRQSNPCNGYVEGTDWDCGDLEEVIVTAPSSGGAIPITYVFPPDSGGDYLEETPNTEWSYTGGGGGGSSTTNSEPITEDDCNTSPENLQQLFPNASVEGLNKLSEMLNEFGAEFGIDTKAEVQHFIAQAGHESGGFTDFNVEENLNYSPERLLVVWSNRFSLSDPSKLDPNDYAYNPEALANVIYCCKYGNGDPASGDGYKYRGRGIFQLTWKENYDKYAQFLNENGLEWMYSGPESLNDPTHAIFSAMWFFSEHVLSDVDITPQTSADTVTEEVNRWTDDKSKESRKKLLEMAKAKFDCL